MTELCGVPVVWVWPSCLVSWSGYDRAVWCAGVQDKVSLSSSLVNNACQLLISLVSQLSLSAAAATQVRHHTCLPVRCQCHGPVHRHSHKRSVSALVQSLHDTLSHCWDQSLRLYSKTSSPVYDLINAKHKVTLNFGRKLKSKTKLTSMFETYC